MSMITVMVKVSSMIRGYEGCDSEVEMEFEAGITAASLKSILALSHEGIIVIVNSKMAGDETEIKHGDSIYILPGLSGG